MSPRRRWLFEGTYRAHSFEYRIRSEVPLAGPFLDRASGNVELLIDGEAARVAETTGLLTDYLLWDVNARTIERTDGYLAIHAAAASLGGAGILLPAPPDSGKTTTVAGLVRAGCSYLTDEAALVDPETGW